MPQRMAKQKAPFIVELDACGGMRITIRAADEHLGASLFLYLWVIGWSVGELGALLLVMVSLLMFLLNAPVIDSYGCLVVLGWLSVWTIAGYIAIEELAWRVRGREIIEADELRLSIARVGTLRRRKPWVFPMSGISNLRYSPGPYGGGLLVFHRVISNQGIGLGYGSGAIAFDYGCDAYRFGSGLSETASRQVINEIAQHLAMCSDRIGM
jgi:hypothetical protein